MKKLCLLLALCLAVFALAAMAEVEEPEEYTSGDFYYALLDDGTAQITYWAGGATVLDIPAALDGHPVSALGDYAFSYWDELERVSLPEGLRQIGTGAFEGCSRLTRIGLPESVVELGGNPFQDCGSLESIDVADGSASLSFRDGALYTRDDGRLVSVLTGAIETRFSVPEGTKVIGTNAFYGCGSLETIDLPDSLEAIEDGAFYACEGLKSLSVPDGVSAIGNYVFAYCDRLQSVRLPEGIETIPPESFLACGSLCDVALPDSVKVIDECAFEGCEGLTEIQLPEGLRQIGDEAFNECTSLERVELPASIEAMGINPFADCQSLAVFSVGDGQDYLSVRDGVLFADGGARLVCYPQAMDGESYAVPEGTERIDEYAFYFCGKLISIEVPDSVTEIGESAFDGRENLTLTVSRESYAMAYARDNNLKYTYPDANDWLNE